MLLCEFEQECLLFLLQLLLILSRSLLYIGCTFGKQVIEGISQLSCTCFYCDFTVLPGPDPTHKSTNGYMSAVQKPLRYFPEDLASPAAVFLADSPMHLTTLIANWCQLAPGCKVLRTWKTGHVATYLA